ncbi:MAG: hypothetical protein SZ59_C0003G0116 [candidate division TM6 bacterium GW2011_GWF2_28_16]|nr:MAG: hypothetical protein SZ59_C0003G0116 [candidate division TM6 bacterium GW2011_GWF2_28_16]
MIVIIDGYNLLKQVFHKIKGKLDLQRDQLINELSFYKSKKHPEIKEIVVVFDGGTEKHAERQINKGIVVVFSGQRQSADEYILDFVKKNKNKEILLVTKDAELKKLCAQYNVDAVDVFDFYDIVKNCILSQIENDIKNKNLNNLYKLEQDDYEIKSLSDYNYGDNKALDILMSQENIEILKKDESDIFIKNKSKFNKMSKKEKSVYKKIKKL